MSTDLLYFHDPMCSWCWAFRPVWSDLRSQLPRNVNVRKILGGLAPDSDEPMSLDMRQKLIGVWRSIQERVPGTQFNFDFWEKCIPRRATYNACRAVLAAARLVPALEEPMILAIQKAYYLDARNPSDISTLVEIAEVVGIERALFEAEMASEILQLQLQEQFNFSRGAPINGFPSLVVQTKAGMYPVALDYCNAAPMLREIESVASL